MLRDAARSLLDSRAPLSSTRAGVEAGAGFDRDLWTEMAGLGWAGMSIPEEYGGAGYSMVEFGVLLEEMGRCLLPAPFLSSVVLGAGAVLAGGTEQQKETLLPGVASGEILLGLATTETRDAPPVTVDGRGSELVVDGTKSYVLDGATADVFIVSAQAPGGDVDLLIVDAGADGVEMRPLPTLDLTRPMAAVRFDGVVVHEDDRLSDGAGVLRHVEALGAVAIGYDSVGGADHCVEMSVEYAKERHQFGRPIGSFQAVKHRCADMLVQAEAARSAAHHAGWAAARDPAELPIAAAIAKSACTDAYFEIAAGTIQVHGGIGFTWEHDAHFYLKRAKANRLLLGNPALWRARLAVDLGL